MNCRSKFAFVTLACLAFVLPLLAQQKGQWVPGQGGLNTGVLPDPGFTFANLTLNYSASSLKDSNGNSIPTKGSYSFWVVESMIYYVPKFKILGGNFAIMSILPAANGSLTAPTFGFTGGGYGYADTWVQPVTLGWHKKRVDNWVAYGFTAPTGRYNAGATNNIGSGYWGQNIVTGTTVYLKKNRGTSASLLTDWEIHGQKKGSMMTPGQAFTMEWGLGQILPLDKQFKKLLQVGIIGYDQWQVTSNGGTIGGATISVPASILPLYSVHAAGFQTNFIMPAKNVSLYFKYEPEYLAKAHTRGRTIAFGAGYTFGIPKKLPPK